MWTYTTDFSTCRRIKSLHPPLSLPFRAPSRYLSVFWYNCQIFPYRQQFLFQFEQPELLPEMPFDIGTVSHSDKFPRFQWSEVLRFIYLFLLCADGHAGITAATAAAGTGGLLLLLVFPEKERVIFQCLHIQCAARAPLNISSSSKAQFGCMSDSVKILRKLIRNGCFRQTWRKQVHQGTYSVMLYMSMHLLFKYMCS